MSQRKADLLLLTVILAWGSSNVWLKIGAGGLAPFNLIALRYTLGFLLTFLIFFKRCTRPNRKTIKYSVLLGFILFAIGYALIMALKYAKASEVSFLASISVFFVPIIMAIWRKQRIKREVIIGMFLAVAGLMLLTNVGAGFAVSLGAAFALLASVINAFMVITTNYTAHNAEDTVQLGVLELGFAALFGWIGSFLLETPRLPATNNEWISVMMLALVCSAYGMVAQTIGQKYTTPEHFGFINALEPVFATVFAYILLDEVMSVTGYIGSALIFLSVLVANGLLVSLKNNRETGYEKDN